MPAHLYRTMLVDEGVLVWDNLWYGGHYPLASYSLLYYLPATVFGNVPLAVAAVIVSAALFASICEGEWGPSAVWPARVFAVLASGPIFTGTYTYALGLLALLAALRLLQADRVGLALVAAALCLGFSPLAYAFLCIAFAAVGIARGRFDRKALIVASGLGLFAAAQATAIWLFPHDAVYPFRLFELGVVLAVCVLGGVLALRIRRARVLVALFALWALSSVAAFLVRSPIGENITRLRGIVFALVLLAAVLARFRPLWLVAPALGLALAYNLVPYVAVIPYRTDGRPAEEAYWEPALDFLRDRSRRNYRVEVVPTADHWEAYWLPKAGFALARGWYRQLDIAQNPLFYEEPLRAHDYRDWLRSMGVRFVLLPDVQLGRYGEEREGELLRSGRSGLRLAYSTDDWRIYELPGAEGVLSGGARVTELGHERIAGAAGDLGLHELAVRYTPYWRVARGSVCLSEGPNGMTLLTVRNRGRFLLELDDSLGGLVRAATGGIGAEC
jgi:hypothetical protein